MVILCIIHPFVLYTIKKAEAEQFARLKFSPYVLVCLVCFFFFFFFQGQQYFHSGTTTLSKNVKLSVMPGIYRNGPHKTWGHGHLYCSYSCENRNMNAILTIYTVMMKVFSIVIVAIFAAWIFYIY